MTNLEKYSAAVDPSFGQYKPFVNSPASAYMGNAKSRKDALVKNLYRNLGTETPYSSPDPDIKIQYKGPKKHTGFGSDFKNEVENLKHKYPKLYKFVRQRNVSGNVNLGFLGKPEYQVGKIKSPMNDKLLGGKLTWRF